MSILTDTRNAELLKQVKSYMYEHGILVLTPEIIDSIIEEFQKAYSKNYKHCQEQN